MTKYFIQLLSIVSISLLFSACSDPKPKIILDTDFGGDADDLGALAMFHNFIDKGECELLAVMCWNLEKYAVSAIDAVNRYYGHPDIPIGTRKGQSEYIDWMHSKPLADAFPFELDADKADEAYRLYRKILSESNDQEVTIVTVGPLFNIKQLIDSKADDISALSGKELISKKVKEFVIMGGEFPSGKKEWNFDGNMKGVTKYVIENIEVPITFSGYEIGLNIKTGEVFNELDKNTPLYVGFKHFSEFAPWLNHQYQGNIYDNSTYDQTAVLYAVRGGIGEYWERIGGGYCQADDVGGNEWVSSENSNHSYLKLLKSNEEMEQIIESFMLNDF